MSTYSYSFMDTFTIASELINILYLKPDFGFLNCDCIGQVYTYVHMYCRIHGMVFQA
jgi:hypothetical protein